MIATIILGFGLLMIGAVLPIAWKGSLEATNYTVAEGASQTAKFYVNKKCRVDGLRDLFENVNHDPLLPPPSPPPVNAADSFATLDLTMRDGTSYSFLGDYDTIDDIDGDNIPDPLVHALHMENWAMDPDSLFICGGNMPDDLSIPEAPILISIDLTDTRTVGIPSSLSDVVPPLCMGYPSRIGAPVIKLGDRVLPPMPSGLTPADVNQWREVLGSRRFAWAVLHRLARIPQSPTDPRQFHMYFVTLRRGNSTNRYAFQQPAPNGNVVPLTPPVAWADTEDVMFPLAWRVPLLVIESQRANGPPTGVPAIVFAGAVDDDVGVALAAGLNPPLAGSTPLDPVDNSVCKVADMFPRGSMFVDEVNGNVYRVTQREYLENAAGRTDQLARLTLDLEVTIADLLDSAGNLERNRVVWVFPPSVSPGDRTSGSGGVRFGGASPVIDIRVETITLTP